MQALRSDAVTVARVWILCDMKGRALSQALQLFNSKVFILCKTPVNSEFWQRNKQSFYNRILLTVWNARTINSSYLRNDHWIWPAKVELNRPIQFYKPNFLQIFRSLVCINFFAKNLFLCINVCHSNESIILFTKFFFLNWYW